MRASSGTSTTTATSATPTSSETTSAQTSRPLTSPRGTRGEAERRWCTAYADAEQDGRRAAGRSRAARRPRWPGSDAAKVSTTQPSAPPRSTAPSRSARRSSGQAPRPPAASAARRNTAATSPIGVARREVASPKGTNGSPRETLVTRASGAARASQPAAAASTGEHDDERPRARDPATAGHDDGPGQHDPEHGVDPEDRPPLRRRPARGRRAPARAPSRAPARPRPRRAAPRAGRPATAGRRSRGWRARGRPRRRPAPPGR